MTRRRGAAAGWACAAAVVVAVASAGCGSTARHASTPTTASTSTSTTSATTRPATLAVRPATPSTRSAMTFTFTAPVATGRHGAQRIAYSLSVTGPAGGGCVGAREAAAGRVAAHAPARIVVAPSPRPWCPGRYTARVLELARAACSAGQPCPQYIRVQATVATGSFTVRRG